MYYILINNMFWPLYQLLLRKCNSINPFIIAPHQSCCADTLSIFRRQEKYGSPGATETRSR